MHVCINTHHVCYWDMQHCTTDEVSVRGLTIYIRLITRYPLNLFFVRLGRMLGVWTRHFLAERLAALPGMKDDLEAGIKIADIGCGYVELHLATCSSVAAVAS